MSKLIEALRAKQEEGRPIAGSATKEVLVEKSSRELTQEHLADIYFSATGKPKTSEPPVIIKVIEKPRVASILPWLITSLAFLITALSLFSTKRVFVDIHVVDDKNPWTQSASQGKSEKPAVESATKKSELILGERIPLEQFVFEGAADLKSSIEDGGLTLINSSVSSFARATLRFERPLDLSHGKLVFFVRGGHGGENLAVALKDKNNAQAFAKGKYYPFRTGLSTSWQRTEVSLSNAVKEFDARNVTNLRFEFGSKEIGNRSGDTIFIKDLSWMPE